MIIKRELTVSEILNQSLHSLELERKLAFRLDQLRQEEQLVQARINAMKEHRLTLETLFS
jgi:hypothetical protein